MLRAELLAMQGELDIASDRITALEDTVSSLNALVVQLQGEIQLLKLERSIVVQLPGPAQSRVTTPALHSQETGEASKCFRSLRLSDLSENCRAFFCGQRMGPIYGAPVSSLSFIHLQLCCFSSI